LKEICSLQKLATLTKQSSKEQKSPDPSINTGILVINSMHTSSRSERGRCEKLDYDSKL
jgi:hypothetical protein